MKARVYPLLALFLFITDYAWSQCNPTFTTSSYGDNYYTFQANQTQLPGFTYANSWSILGQTQNTYTSSFSTQFNMPGTYNVCHYIVIQDSGSITVCRDSSCQNITVIPSCITPFYSNAFQTNGLTCNFTSSIGSYNNLQLTWYFGDGTSVTGEASPIHTYPAYGDYDYCLYVTDTVNHCTDSSCSTTYVDSFSMCNAYGWFQAVQPNLNNTTVYFINSVYGSTDSSVVATYNFGDGSYATSTSNNDTIIHTFPGYGSYWVTVTDSDMVMQCSYTYNQLVSVNSCSAALAAFSSSLPFGQANTAYFWTDSSAALNAPQIWSFGDGTADSIGTYPSHTYTSAGTYTVCLTVQIPGCTVPTWCDTVTVGCNLDPNFSFQEINGSTISYTPEMANWYQTDLNVTYNWYFGDGSSSNEEYPTHVFTDTGTFNTCLIVTDTIAGCSDTFCTSVTYEAWTDTVCGTVFADYNGNGIQDIGEPGMPNTIVYLQGYYSGNSFSQVTTDANGAYMAVLPPDAVNEQTLIYTGLAGQLYSLPFFSNYSYYFSQGFWGYYSYQFTGLNQHQCGFDFGVINGPTLVQGTVYSDDNSNGIRDGYEQGIPNQLVDIGNGQSVVTLNDGQYFAYVDTGTYNLHKDASGFFAANTVTPASITLPVPAYFAQDTGNNFGLQISASTHDLVADLIPFSPVSPGQLSSYEVQVTNLSNNYEYYTDSLTMDPSLSPDPYYNSFTDFNTATNTGYWEYNNIYPFSSWPSPMVYDASLSLVYNQDLYSSAGIALLNNTDNNPGNNADTLHQIVVASYDPNFKQANVPGRTAMGYISTSQELKYSISFQNTGNGNAINIIVKDILDPSFDLKSFRFISSSYSQCDVRLAGDTVYFRLSGIQLPPESQTTTGSVAWVAYSIKPKQGLAGQTPLHNTASVYFDHNAPVTTNTTIHTIDGNAPSDVQNIYNDGQLTIAPNPFGSQTNFKLQNMPGNKYNYAVTDVLGRTVTEGVIMNGETKTLYRNSLSAGTYIITFSNENGIVKRSKIIAQ